MLVRRIVVLLLVLAQVSFGSFATTASAAAVPVGCGGTVVGAGILTGDLDCTTPDQPITIAKGRLDLQGFALQGGIVCAGSCKISNGTIGGPISGVKSIGLRDVVKYGDLITNGHVRVKNSAVSSGVRCLSAYFGKITVEDSVIADCQTAVDANQNGAKITGTSITNSRHIGVLGTKVVLKSSTVTGSGFGVECGHSFLDRICSGGPDEGLACGPGVDCDGGSCVRGAICGDVVAFKRPVLRDSTCGTSVNASGAPFGWGVCSLD
jgi:hypothetical protein